MYLFSHKMEPKNLEKHYNWLWDSQEGSCIFVFIPDEVELRGGWAPQVMGLCLRHGHNVWQDKDT